MTNIWKFFWRKAGYQPETIAEVERMLNEQINKFDRYA